MIKEIPMLYSTEMVKATLDDRKTMTRRTKGLDIINENPDAWKLVSVGLFHLLPNRPNAQLIEKYGASFISVEKAASEFFACPYGKPGDVIWVRETWASANSLFHGKDVFSHYVYKADGDPLHNFFKWKPSIHMPKAAARIWLEITDVRVERLQNITAYDAMAEGALDTIKLSEFDKLRALGNWKIPSPFVTYQFGFLSLWCRINGTQSWLLNPWVWVISFKVLSKTGKPETIPSGFTTERLKSSPTRTKKKLVEEARQLPGNGEKKEVRNV